MEEPGEGRLFEIATPVNGNATSSSAALCMSVGRRNGVSFEYVVCICRKVVVQRKL